MIPRAEQKDDVPKVKDLEAQTDAEPVKAASSLHVLQKLQEQDQSVTKHKRRIRAKTCAIIAPSVSLMMTIGILLLTWGMKHYNAISADEAGCPSLDFANHGTDDYCMNGAAINSSLCNFLNDWCEQHVRAYPFEMTFGILLTALGATGVLMSPCIGGKIGDEFEKIYPAPIPLVLSDKDVLDISSKRTAAGHREFKVPTQPSAQEVKELIEFLNIKNKGYAKFYKDSLNINLPDGVKAIVGEYMGADKFAMQITHNEATLNKCTRFVRTLKSF